MNRGTFLKTLAGLVAAPAVVIKALQAPKRDAFMETYCGDVLIRRVYIDDIQWMYIKDGSYRSEKMHSNCVRIQQLTPIGSNFLVTPGRT